METTTDRVSLTFLAPRNDQFPRLKKPTRVVCFSDFVPFPKSRYTQERLFLFQHHHHHNYIFARDRRQTKPIYRNPNKATKPLLGEEIMAITTGRVSLITCLAPRNRFPCLKKPTRVCFSDFGPFPKSRFTIGKIVPPLASSSLNHIFARRLTKPVSTSRATNDENSIPQAEDDKPTNRWFPMVYCCVGFMWMYVMYEQLPLYVMFHIFVTLHLEAIEYFFSSSNLDGRFSMYHLMVMGISCIWFLADRLGCTRLVPIIGARFCGPVLKTQLSCLFEFLKVFIVSYSLFLVAIACCSICFFSLIYRSYKLIM